MNTEIAKKLDIKKIYLGFDGSEILKVVVIRKGDIKNQQNAIDKVNLFVISEFDKLGSKGKKFTYNELEGILGKLNLPAQNQYVRDAKDDLKVKLVKIIKTTGEISVEVSDDKLSNGVSSTEFKEIKQYIEKNNKKEELWKNPENDIAKLTNPDKEEVKKPLKKILEKVNEVHSEYKSLFVYADKAREAAHHGFVAGVLVNFRYRHNLRVYLEQFAGRGYADIVLVPRGEKRALDAIPIIMELKAATKEELEKGGVKIKDGSQTTPAVALKQAEDYTKGFQPNVMRVLTTADDILCVGVNLDHPSPISDIVAKSRDQKIIPLFNDILGSIDERNSGKIDEGELKKQIQNNIERVYHIFPGTGEKGDSHYFSRFLLGQSLLLNEVKDLKTSFEKHIFVYEENLPTEVRLESKGRGIPQRQAAKKVDEKLAESSRLDESHAVVTMVFISESDKKLAYVMNIVEADGRAEVISKGIPLDKLKREIGNRKIVELNLNFNIKEQKSDLKKYFSVEVNEPISLGEYNGKKSNKFKGDFKDVPYPKDFKKTFNEVLVSQFASSQDQSLSTGKYKELFGKVGKAMLPFKGLIEKEAHTQAIFHGVFSHYSDIKLGEPKQKNRALILTEFQTGRGKRIDMLINGVKFADQDSNAKEYIPVGLELKGPRGGKTADELITEADDQITKEYTKGVVYKTLTDGDKVFIMGVVFDAEAQSSNSLLKVTDKLFPVDVIHSSKVRGNISKSRRPIRHKIFNRELNSLQSFKVNSNAYIPDWVDIGRDRLKDSNRDLTGHSFDTLFKNVRDMQNYLNKLPIDLQSLDLSEINLNDSEIKILCSFLNKHKNINAIDLSYNQLSLIGIKYLIDFLIRNNHKISFLDLSENDMGSNGDGSEAIESLAKFIEANKIDSLVISDVGMTSNDFIRIFSALKKNTSIKALDLSFNKIERGFSQEIAESLADVLYTHKKITALNLANTGVNDFAIQIICDRAQNNHQGKSPIIKELNISNFDLKEEKRITKERIKPLVKFLEQTVQLEDLRLSGNPIEIEGLRELVNVLKGKNVKTLDISEISLECNQHNAQIIKDVMHCLIDELNTIVLNLGDNKLDAKAIKEIFSSMVNREKQVLKRLNLSGNSAGDSIDPDILEAISSSLKVNSVLVSLNLSSMSLCDADIEEIVGALKKSIIDLDISGNDIDKNTMQELVDFLKNNPELRFLNIANYDSKKRLLPQGTEDLFQTLKDENKILTHLDISGYIIDNKSIDMIANNLKSNIGFQYFSLANSEFNENPEQSLKILFDALKGNTNLQFMDIRGIPITDKIADKMIEYLKGSNTVQVLRVSVDELSEEKVKDLTEASQKVSVVIESKTPLKIVDSSHHMLPTVGQCSKGKKRGSSSPGYSPNKKVRQERSFSIVCIDSRDEEKITEEEKEQRIKELFNADKVVEKVKNIEFYDQLFKVSQKISRGEIIDKNVEEAFVAKIKDIDLSSIDPEIRDIVKEMKDNIENKEEMKNILKRSGVAGKIGKVAEGTGLAFTAFLVGKHIANGDIEGLGYDALNLWVMPKIGEKISEKILGLGTKLDSQILKGFAPVMGRAIGNFAAFLGLAESIKARQSATDPVDIKIADLNIVTNSIFIAADVPAVVTETMSVVGLETGVIGELAGPVGAAISVAVIIISQFAEAELEVEKLKEHINLTNQEKHDFYWDFFLGRKIPNYIENDMEAEERYKQYISKIVDKFKNDYSRIAISLPPISVKKVLRQKKRGVVDDIDNQMKHLFDACRIRTQVVGREFDFNFTATMSSSNTRYTGHYSRIVPHSLENYNIVCGPHDDNIAVKTVSKEINLPSDASCSSVSQYNNMKLSITIEKWFLQEHMNDCHNAVSYNRNNPFGPVKVLFYMSNNNAFINVTSNYTIDVIFNGKNILLNSYEIDNQGSSIQNRYYFTNQLSNCDIHKQGTNFFYIAKDNFVCNLGGSSIGQNNIVVTRGNFTDSENIHSIIGSDKANHIEVSHAGYVDGKGGNDVITAKNFTTIKGYFGDSIYGKGLVLLPINFNDIDNVTHANNITNIYNKSGVFISVKKQTLVKTVDDLFVTPTKVDINGIVTNLQVTKSVGSNVILDDELDNLRKIDNSNFNITKQLLSTNYHSTIGSASNHIFYPDKEYHNFYWEAPSNISHLYLFDERNANITIAKANGILDFSQLNSTLNDMPFIENDKGEIKINKNGLNVTLLSDYKDVTVTFDGEEYYKFQDGELERDYCSHSLKIDGRFSVNGTDLLNHHNCFTFDSDKVLFLKLNNDLLLLSGKGALSISDYYSSVHKNWDLSIGLNNRIMEPEEFGERADDFSSFRYYQPGEQGLQIYHNQPVNKNDIGLVDLKGKSILDFDMRVINDNLLLLHKNNTLVKVENWNTYQPAREMMFAFNDTIVSNAKCIASTCNSEDVIVGFNKEKVEQVFNAIVQGNINKAKDLVKKIENIDTRGNYELTLLYVAIRETRLDVVKLLFDKKYVNVEGRDAYYHTPLHLAIQEDRLGIAKFLLDQGADIEAKDQYGWTSIYYAIYKNNFDILKFLIDNGADIEAKTINNEIPLYMTVKDNNKFKMFRLLLDKGANIEAKTKDGWTSLHYAAYKGNLDVCKLLLEKGASIEAKNINDGTPLHVAAENNNRSKVTVELLLDKGANIEAKSKNGWTPLHCAAYKDNLNVCKLLLDKGANIEAKTKDGWTPLNIANYMKHFDVVEYLEKFKEERGRPVQRKHRHHHGDHNHLSRKLLAVDLNNQPEIATSSGTRPSSWINDLVNSCISTVKGLGSGLSTAEAALLIESEETSNVLNKGNTENLNNKKAVKQEKQTGYEDNYDPIQEKEFEFMLKHDNHKQRCKNQHRKQHNKKIVNNITKQSFDSKSLHNNKMVDNEKRQYSEIAYSKIVNQKQASIHYDSKKHSFNDQPKIGERNQQWSGIICRETATHVSSNTHRYSRLSDQVMKVNHNRWSNKINNERIDSRRMIANEYHSQSNNCKPISQVTAQVDIPSTLFALNVLAMNVTNQKCNKPLLPKKIQKGLRYAEKVRAEASGSKVGGKIRDTLYFK